MKKVIIFLLVLTSSSIAFAKGEWRNDFSVRAEMAEKLSLDLKAKQKVEEFSDVGSHYLAVLPSYHLAKWITLGGEYRHVFSKEEDRLALVPTLKWRFANLKFSDRNKLEYRIRSSNSVRYRNRVKAARKVKVFNHFFSPYLSEEIFYDLTKGDFSSNELSLGFSTSVAKNVGFGLYYMLQNDLTGASKPTNILGSSLALNI